MSAEYPQPQSVPQAPYAQPGMQPGMPPGTGYYPVQGGQYGPPPQHGPALANFPGQVLGLVMVAGGAVLALLGLILALVADMNDSNGSGFKSLILGAGFLVVGILLIGQWLATTILAKARS